MCCFLYFFFTLQCGDYSLLGCALIFDQIKSFLTDILSYFVELIAATLRHKFNTNKGFIFPIYIHT